MPDAEVKIALQLSLLAKHRSTDSYDTLHRCAVKPCLPLLTVLRPTPQPFRSATHRPVPRRQLVTYAKQDGGNSQLPGIALQASASVHLPSYPAAT